MDVTDKISGSTYMGSHYFEPSGEYVRTKRDLEDIILRIRQEYGSDIVNDIFRFNALLMDYAPSMVKERKLIINALREGTLMQLRRGVEANEPIDEVVGRCTALLISEMFITEAAARYVVGVMVESMLADVAANEENSDECGRDLSGEKQLIKGEKSFGTVVSESDLKDYDSIGYKAFAYERQITEVNIPDNIKKIYPKAFKGCGSLKSVSITGGTEVIGRNIFEGCICLQNVIIQNNPNYTAEDGFFIDRKNGILMQYTDRGKKTVSVANGIKVIGRRAFEFSEAEQIIISESVEKTEEDAFFCTMNLKRIDTDENNRHFRSPDGVLHSYDGKVLIRYPQGRTDVAYYLEDGVAKIGKKAFKDAVFLSSVSFTDTLKEIGESAFENCTGIENIIIPRSVELIGERAFRYCESVGNVILPQGIVSIGACAFQGCGNLKGISVPRSVREIGNMAFMDCTSLKRAVIQENVLFIGNEAFSGCPDIEVTISNNEYVAVYCKMHGIKYTAV